MNFAALSSAYCVTSAARIGPTFDEPIYLTRGLEGWRDGSRQGLLKQGLVEAVERAQEVILRAGIPLGGAALTAAQTHTLAGRGCRLLWHNFDVLMLKQYVKETAEWRSGPPLDPSSGIQPTPHDGHGAQSEPQGRS